jgi:hypothetical protein
MGSEWFVLRGGEKSGPFTSRQLKDLAQQGALLGSDLLWKEGMRKPKEASKAKRLFTVAERAGSGSQALQSKARADQATSSPVNAGACVPRSCANVTDKVRTAALVASLAAERTALTTFTIPAAYRNLGQLPPWATSGGTTRNGWGRKPAPSLTVSMRT